MATLEGDSLHYVHTDHLTGSNVVTDSSGGVEQALDYYPYGSIRLDEKTGTFNEQRKFAGHEYDEDMGLSYQISRYYNGLTGKFTSQDPAFWDFSQLQTQLIDPQSWNSYAYGRNNPIKHNDPDGRFWDTVVDLGFTVWDASKFIQSSGTWLGDQASIGLGKVSGNERLENNGRQGAVASGAALKNASVDLGIDIGATLIPGVPAFAGRVDDVTRVLRNVDNVSSLRSFRNQTDLQKIWTDSDRYKNSVTSALEHWKSHRSEFSELQNSKQYVEAAHNFINNPPKGTLYRPLEKGREAFYNQASNTLVITQKGVPGTMFKPSAGIKYFNGLK